MLTPILVTKLYFPQARTSLVSRPRLIDRLVDGLKGSLTLISAPAGYGKTTLLAEWRLGPGKNTPFAWVSIDAGDNDLARFLLYLCASLNSLQPGLLELVQPLLQTTELPNPEAISTLLVNQMNLMDHDFIQVLDDYHLIETPAIHHAIMFLIDHMPQRWHLVILTRSDPAFPLSRLRAQNQMTEIRAKHLRFSTEETAQFLDQVMGLNVSKQEVTLLEARTEGWIAGLQLAALSMRNRDDISEFVKSFSGSQHYIVDYLAEEVLSCQPETVRDFLIKTSILERLSGSLCDVVAEAKDSDNLLKLLDHGNVFLVPLDDEQHWYRYHQLFADLLLNRLRHSYPDIIAPMHRRAADWFEKNDLVDEAITHALAAKDFPHAAGLFCRNNLEIVYSRNLSTLDRWLEAFSDASLLANPWMCIAKANVLWSTGRRTSITAFILGAEKALGDWVATGQITPMDEGYFILQGYIYTFQSLMAMNSNDLALAVSLAQKAVGIIPKSTRSRAFALGSLYIAYQLSGEIDRGIDTCYETITTARKLNYPSMLTTSTYSLALLLRVKGQLHHAADMLKECLDYAQRHKQSHVFYYGIVHIALAETFFEWNALEEMDSALNAGLALCRQGGMNILVITGLFNRVSLRFARRDFQGALDALDEIEQECKEMDPREYQEDCTGMRYRIRAEMGDFDGLEKWLQVIDLNIKGNPGTGRFAQLYRASWFLNVMGKPGKAIEILSMLESLTRENGYTGWLIYILVLQALCWKCKQETQRAMHCLREALALAEPEGYVRIFLNFGEPIEDMLLEARRLDFMPEFTSRILVAAGRKLASLKTPLSAPPILTPRQLELLQLIAAGHTNQQIANELFISVGTVKRHTANIFDKLDVNNRTEAVARARDLNLVS